MSGSFCPKDHFFQDGEDTAIIRELEYYMDMLEKNFNLFFLSDFDYKFGRRCYVKRKRLLPPRASGLTEAQAFGGDLGTTSAQRTGLAREVFVYTKEGVPVGQFFVGVVSRNGTPRGYVDTSSILFLSEANGPSERVGDGLFPKWFEIIGFCKRDENRQERISNALDDILKEIHNFPPSGKEKRSSKKKGNPSNPQVPTGSSVSNTSVALASDIHSPSEESHNQPPAIPQENTVDMTGESPNVMTPPDGELQDFGTPSQSQDLYGSGGLTFGYGSDYPDSGLFNDGETDDGLSLNNPFYFNNDYSVNDLECDC